MNRNLNIRKDPKCKKNKEIPNKETLEAYKEACEIEANLIESKTFKDIESLMDDLLN